MTQNLLTCQPNTRRRQFEVELLSRRLPPPEGPFLPKVLTRNEVKEWRPRKLFQAMFTMFRTKCFYHKNCGFF